MKTKFIPLGDWLLWGGFSVFGIICALGIVFTQQEWNTEKLAIVFTLVPIFIATPVAILLMKYYNKPEFTTVHNVHVWTENTVISRARLEHAVRFYIDHFVKLEPGISRSKVNEAFDGLKLTFVNEPISTFGFGWSVKNAAGLHLDKVIWVVWHGYVSTSALFHEFNHLVDQYVYKRESDPRHINKTWWNWESTVSRMYAEVENNKLAR